MLNVVKTRKVTFSTGLPRGACATFTHEGERWIAYPQSKVQAVAATIDRLIGTLDGIARESVRWINNHPEDAAWMAERILSRTNAAREIAREKAAAWTMQQESGQSNEVPPTENSEAEVDTGDRDPRGTA